MSPRPRKARVPDEILPHSEDSDSESSERSDSDEGDANDDDFIEAEAEGLATEAMAVQVERGRVSREMREHSIDTGARAISPTDPLRRYIEEIKRYPLLTPEEEVQLVSRMHEKGDMGAAKALVSANLRLVVKIAFEYQSVYSNLLDLIQEGNMGLMKAVSKFDPSKGARLGYYSSWWIRSYILKYLLDNFRLVKVGTTQAQKKLFYHLMREKEKLEAQGLLAGPKLLAEKLHVREKDVVEMQQRLSSSGSEVSLDAPIGNDSDESSSRSSHIDHLPDGHAGADESLEKAEWLQLLRDQLPEFEKKLNEKERRLLHERLLAEEPKTLQEVADRYGLTRERARQIEAKVVLKLRDFLKDYLAE